MLSGRGLANRCLKPLGHLSIVYYNKRIENLETRIYTPPQISLRSIWGPWENKIEGEKGKFANLENGSQNEPFLFRRILAKYSLQKTAHKMSRF